MPTLLLVDDQPEVLDLLAAHCEDAGYTAHIATSGHAALRVLYDHRPDVVVTDVRMPGMDGFELVSRIRELASVPIIVLSAVGDPEEREDALRAGATDYVVKTEGVQAILEHIQAVLDTAQPAGKTAPAVYKDRALTLDLARHEAFLEGQKIDLTPKELKLLGLLAQNSHRVVSVPEILQQVWGSTHYSDESVKWHIASLRRKIEVDPKDPKLVITVWGTGYRYDPPRPVSEDASSG